MSEAQVKPKPGFKVARVLAVAVPVILLVLLGFGYLTFFGGIEQINAWTAPPVIKVTGQVLWNGKPVPDAQIATIPARSSLRGALAVADQDGRFVLTTDINGKLIEGAYAGKHKVTVAGHRPAQGPSPPTLITPQDYSSFSTTPLEIDVTRDPEANVVKLELKGEAPPAGGPAGGAPMMMGGGGPPPGGGGPGGGGPGGGGPGGGGAGGRRGPPPPVMPSDLEKQQESAPAEDQPARETPAEEAPSESPETPSTEDAAAEGDEAAAAEPPAEETATETPAP